MKRYPFLACVMVLACIAANGQSYYSVEPVHMAAFGGAVAVGDGEFFVGEPVSFKNPGRVHVYRQDTEGDWEATAILSASTAHVNDGFGGVLAQVDNTLFVASGQNGIVYVFERYEATGNWEETAQLSAQDGESGNAFGASIAAQGEMVLIGAPRQSEGTGAVYVFERAAESWEQTGVLTPEGETTQFGHAVHSNGERTIITAPMGDERAVYIYKVDASGAWTLEARLEQGALLADLGPASAVAIQGAEAFVSFPRTEQFAGSVQVFQFDAEAGAWQAAGSLKPDADDVRAMFGSALQVNSDELWVGAPGSGGYRGAVYRFSRGEVAEVWEKAARWQDARLKPRDRFATALAVRGDVAVVGASGVAYGEGSVFVLRRTEEDWENSGFFYDAKKAMEPILGSQIDCDTGTAATFECAEVDLVAFLPLAELGTARGVRLSDVWGWTDPETDKEYALVGHLEGTVFVDVSDASHPVFLGELPRTEGAPGSTWRDIKVYKDHAFIVADGAAAHGMQVFDLAQLRDVTEVPTTFEAVAHYDKIHSAHNIVINEETGFAYSVGSSAGGETCGGGLHMIDIREPAAPAFAGCFADPTTGRRKTGYSHDAQCVVYHGPDSEHTGKEICVGSNETAISIADVTDKEVPIAIGSGAYPDFGYVHQGWLSEDHRYFFQNDELDELSAKTDRTRTLIWDITDLDDPVMVKEFFGLTSATDHNLYVHGNLMYQTNNASGLRIIDIANPEDPTEVGFFDTTPYGTNNAGFNGTWSSYPYFKSGMIVVTSRREGLFILKKRKLDT